MGAIECPRCHAMLRVPAGSGEWRTLECPKCSTRFTVDGRYAAGATAPNDRKEEPIARPQSAGEARADKPQEYVRCLCPQCNAQLELSTECRLNQAIVCERCKSKHWVYQLVRTWVQEPRQQQPVRRPLRPSGGQEHKTQIDTQLDDPPTPQSPTGQQQPARQPLRPSGGREHKTQIDMRVGGGAEMCGTGVLVSTEGGTYELHPGKNILGRPSRSGVSSAGVNVPLRVADAHASVSRRHCQIEVIEKRQRWQYILSDLESRNGTFLNGHRLNRDEEVYLQPGDEVMLSPDGCSLQFEIR